MWLERGTHTAPGGHPALLFSCCRNLSHVTRRPHPRPVRPPPPSAALPVAHCCPAPCPSGFPWTP
eukprot:4479285-Prymnesium_polylepis.1